MVRWLEFFSVIPLFFMIFNTLGYVRSEILTSQNFYLGSIDFQVDFKSPVFNSSASYTRVIDSKRLPPTFNSSNSCGNVSVGEIGSLSNTKVKTLFFSRFNEEGDIDWMRSFIFRNGEDIEITEVHISDVFEGEGYFVLKGNILENEQVTHIVLMTFNFEGELKSSVTVENINFQKFSGSVILTDPKTSNVIVVASMDEVFSLHCKYYLLIFDVSTLKEKYRYTITRKTKSEICCVRLKIEGGMISDYSLHDPGYYGKLNIYDFYVFGVEELLAESLANTLWDWKLSGSGKVLDHKYGDTNECFVTVLRLHKRGEIEHYTIRFEIGKRFVSYHDSTVMASQQSRGLLYIPVFEVKSFVELNSTRRLTFGTEYDIIVPFQLLHSVPVSNCSIPLIRRYTPNKDWMVAYIFPDYGYNLIKSIHQTVDDGHLIVLVHHSNKSPHIPELSSVLKINLEDGSYMLKKKFVGGGIIEKILQNYDGTFSLWVSQGKPSASTTNQLYFGRIKNNLNFCNGIFENYAMATTSVDFFVWDVGDNLSHEDELLIYRTQELFDNPDQYHTGVIKKFITRKDYCFVCDNILKDSPLVCSTHGTCISEDHCLCQNGYHGEDCKDWSCFSLPKSDPLVCDGHGRCSEYNKCVCGFGYGSEDCSSWECDLISHSDIKHVCHGKGNCSSPENCTCNSHYHGTYCGYTFCGNISSKFSQKVCSGHGRCWPFQKCECDEYYHVNKEEMTCVLDGEISCFHIPYSDKAVCNGHGKCSSNNKCDCKFPYSGLGCTSLKYLNGIVGGATAVLIFFICIFYAVILCCCIFIGVSVCVFSSIIEHYEKRIYIDLNGEIHPLIQAENLLIQDGTGNQNRVARMFRSKSSSSTTSLWKREVLKEENEKDPSHPNYFVLLSNTKSKKMYLEYEGGMDETNQMKSGVGIEFYVFNSELPKPPKKTNFNKMSETRKCEWIRKSLVHENGRRFLKRFEGMFLKGKRSGRGIEFSRKEVPMLEGVWKNGKIIQIDREYIDIPEVDLSKIECRHEDIIGIGAEGIVYRVEFNEEVVAMKILNEVKQRPLQILQVAHLLRSQSIWSTVQEHPSILELRGWCGRKYSPIGYLMEICEKNLSEYIQSGEVDMKSKLRILYQVADVMRYLHSRSIMHRDLKTSNVLLDFHSMVKLCDFEFCRYDDEDYRLHSSMKSSLVGTPISVAPEVINGTRYSKSCDVYSFGILVFCVYFQLVNPYALTTQCPNCGSKLKVGDQQIVYHVLNCELTPVVDKRKVIEEKWLIEELFSMCIKRDPSERPSFDEIVKLFRKKMMSKED